MMAYFPFFVDLNGKTGLIVGGGAVALVLASAVWAPIFLGVLK